MLCEVRSAEAQSILKSWRLLDRGLSSMKQTRMRERGIGRFEAKISRVAIGGREVYAAEKKGKFPGLSARASLKRPAAHQCLGQRPENSRASKSGQTYALKLTAAGAKAIAIDETALSEQRQVVCVGRSTRRPKRRLTNAAERLCL